MTITNKFLPFVVMVTSDFDCTIWFNIATCRLYYMMRSTSYELAELDPSDGKSFQSVRVIALNSLSC